jgi:hypothetical protein
MDFAKISVLPPRMRLFDLLRLLPACTPLASLAEPITLSATKDAQGLFQLDDFDDIIRTQEQRAQAAVDRMYERQQELKRRPPVAEPAPSSRQAGVTARPLADPQQEECALSLRAVIQSSSARLARSRTGTPASALGHQQTLDALRETLTSQGSSQRPATSRSTLTSKQTSLSPTTLPPVSNHQSARDDVARPSSSLAERRSTATSLEKLTLSASTRTSRRNQGMVRVLSLQEPLSVNAQESRGDSLRPSAVAWAPSVGSDDHDSVRSPSAGSRQPGTTASRRNSKGVRSVKSSSELGRPSSSQSKATAALSKSTLALIERTQDNIQAAKAYPAQEEVRQIVKSRLAGTCGCMARVRVG